MEIALIEEVREPAAVRRFEIPDLSRHGPWLLKRFATVFPDFSEKQVAGYLNGLIYNNEHLFSYQEHAVALFALTHNPGIKTTLVAWERFVWVEDKTDKEQLEYAADFYSHAKRWAKASGAERIIVCENTDVPKSLIENRLGRVYDTKISFTRM
jgi:hypothetical protein